MASREADHILRPEHQTFHLPSHLFSIVYFFKYLFILFDVYVCRDNRAISVPYLRHGLFSLACNTPSRQCYLATEVQVLCFLSAWIISMCHYTWLCVCVGGVLGLEPGSFYIQGKDFMDLTTFPERTTHSSMMSSFEAERQQDCPFLL